MTRGKHWTTQEETELKALVEANNALHIIAAKLQRTPGAVLLKAQRMGLEIDAAGYSATRVAMPRSLPSVEETLRMLAAAMKTASTPGLDKSEISRIQAVSNIAKTYKEVLEDYVNYRQIELKLREMEEENARLHKERGEGDAAGSASSPVAESAEKQQ